MSEPSSNVPVTRASRVAGSMLSSCLACCFLIGSVAGAEDPLRVGIAKSLSPKAMIFSRQAPGKEWQLVDENGPLVDGDLILGLPGAKLESKKGSVTLAFLSDLDQISPYPVLESAVVLRENSKVDLEFTLDRGRVDVANSKKEGSAVVRVHVRNGVWDLTLADPGARVALEVYGSWPRGARFSKDPGPKDVPATDLIILALKGEVAMKHAGVELPMKAPPGPSIIEWDSVTGLDDCCHKLEKLPPWAASGQEDTPKTRAKKAVLEQFRQRVLKKPIAEVIEAMLNSDNPDERRIGTVTAGAFDQLDILGNALRETKHADVWDNGVLVLRHWIGRAPGQDQILYNALIEKRNYKPVHAETIVQLLHSFGDEDLAHPETYEALIAFLNHENLAIRGLAYWHLSRLVPEGKKFGYNLMDSKEDRAKAVEQWKKLIPSGQMPPKPKIDAEK
jgi:hypothetical protein